MRILACLLCAALVACGGGDTGYTGSMEYDYITASGVRVRFEPEIQPVHYDRLTPEVVESRYQGVVSCLGIFAEGPLVVIVPERNVYGDAQGYTYFDDGVILVSQTDTYQALMRHEFVHHILARSGFPASKNTNHEHWAFEWCDNYDHPPDGQL